MSAYRYRPLRFYLLVFGFTWLFWFSAIWLRESGAALTLMFLGLCVPAVTAVLTVLWSDSAALKADFRRKLFRFYQLRPGSLLLAVLVFAAVVCLSIALSVLFAGQSWAQFAFVDFSFSIEGSSALLTILLAAVIEELGWRGYGEDAVGQYFNWFTESLIFGAVWACWHLPLFCIPGTYHAGLLAAGRALGAGNLFAVNFLISVIPLDFLTTWVYVRNGRSMLASILFHLAVNFMQEKIAMTPVTKCVETAVITVAAVVIVAADRDLFFEKRHIGRLLEPQPAPAP